MTTFVQTSTLSNITHPAWCDTTQCSAEVHREGIDVFHALTPVALPNTDGRVVYALAAGADAVEIYADRYETDHMTPAQARALAAALVAVADAVDPAGAQ